MALIPAPAKNNLPQPHRKAFPARPAPACKINLSPISSFWRFLLGQPSAGKNNLPQPHRQFLAFKLGQPLARKNNLPPRRLFWCFLLGQAPARKKNLPQPCRQFYWRFLLGQPAPLLHHFFSSRPRPKRLSPFRAPSVADVYCRNKI